MSLRYLRSVPAVTLFVLFTIAFFNPALAVSLDAQSLFQRVKKSIVQVKISNIHSDEKFSIGSGFFVSNDGHLITNYHVIASVLREPENYRAEVILHNGKSQTASIIDFDLIHDLALLHSASTTSPALSFYLGELKKGGEIASIGNPHDLGMTVVRGSYSGYVENSLYERMHFTGAINPGMSGGPALNKDAEIVGINVATAGNEVGFLVPGKYAHELLLHGKNSDQPLDTRLTMQHQLQQNQEHISRHIFLEKFPVTELGNYLVPKRLSKHMKCWGNSLREEDKPFQITSKQCSTEDEIYIDNAYSTGTISLEHIFISSEKLSAHRFSRLYEKYFNAAPSIRGNKDDLTSFECNTNFVDTGSLRMKLALCLRQHRQFQGLYDMMLKGASLGEPSSGIQTTLLVTGINYGNAMGLVQRYISAFRWKE